jgi:hypothetical protein
MGGGDVEVNVCVVGGDLLGVPGPQKTKKKRPFGSKNGSETAQKRPERRPSFGQAHGKRIS